MVVPPHNPPPVINNHCHDIDDDVEVAPIYTTDVDVSRMDRRRFRRIMRGNADDEDWSYVGLMIIL